MTNMFWYSKGRDILNLNTLKAPVQSDVPFCDQWLLWILLSFESLKMKAAEIVNKCKLSLLQSFCFCIFASVDLFELIFHH